jgi:hypothetical protein
MRASALEIAVVDGARVVVVTVSGALETTGFRVAAPLRALVARLIAQPNVVAALIGIARVGRTLVLVVAIRDKSVAAI